MTSVFGFQPECGYAYRARLDGRHLALEHAPLIHRSIYSDLLYCPSPAAGHMYVPELFYLCLYDEVEQAGVRLGLSFCPVHVVVGQFRQQHYTLAVLAQGPHRQIVVVACASHWYNDVLNKRFKTPFYNGIWNRRQVSVDDRGSFPHDPEIVRDRPSWDPGWGRVRSGEAWKPNHFLRYVHPTR